MLPQPACLSAVAAFHRLFRCPVLRSPQIPSAARCELRVSLIAEELQELKDAIREKDLVEVADALCDIQYVLSGAVLEFGMGSLFKTLFDEVQRSNMSKTCKSAEEARATQEHYKATRGVESVVEQRPGGKFLVFRAGDRKVLKSVNYSAVSLAPILQAKAARSSPQTQEDNYSMPDTLNAVASFHQLFRAPILPTPTIPDEKRCELRVSLIAEELQELKDAIKQNDLVEVADALCDIQYVLSGAVLEFGMGSLFKTLFDEVQRSNMSKACASLQEAEATREHYRTNYKPPTDSTIEKVDCQFLVYRAGDHKVLKSVKYSPVNFNGILGQYLSTTSSLGAVAVNQVARVFRLKITGENDALKLDALIRGDGLSPLRALPGYVKTMRQLCKSEWAYEVSLIFDSGSNFDGYMASKEQAAFASSPAMAIMKELAVDGKVYVGARVHDDNML